LVKLSQRRAVLVAVTALALVLFAGASLVHAASEDLRLSLSQQSANAGDTVTFSISGTEAGEEWRLSIDGDQIKQGTDPNGGGVTGKFTVPNLGHSSRTVSVTAIAGGIVSSKDLRYVVPSSGTTGGGGGSTGQGGQSPVDDLGTVAPPVGKGKGKGKGKRPRPPATKKRTAIPTPTVTTPTSGSGNTPRSHSGAKNHKKHKAGKKRHIKIGPVGRNKVLVNVPEQGRNSLRSLEPRPIGAAATNLPKAAAAKKSEGGFPLGIAILALSVLGVLFLGAMILSRAWSFEDYDKSMQTAGIDKAEEEVIAEIKERTAELESARAAELAERSREEAKTEEAPTAPVANGEAPAALPPYDPQPLGEDSETSEPVTREHAEVVSGLAQDVLVRAQEHGVNGWVQKRADGTLEAVFEGDPEAVERLVQFCQKGPRGTDVERVETFEEKPEGLSGFSVR
jgi:acylphosphatase